MSEQWPTSGSHESDAEPDDGSSSLNGADPGEADAAPDASAEGIVSEQVGEPAETAGQTDAAEPADLDDGSGFVTELVRAMQTTAGVERARTVEETERRRQVRIDDVRAREATQADRIRELAAGDQKAIETWADAEMKRIQAERERRTTELNKDLETSLALHHAEINREVEGIETVIAAYRAEVATYFDSFDHSTDPVLIAQQAARRPVFPALDAAPQTVAAPEEVAAPEAVAAPVEITAAGAVEAESLEAVEAVAEPPADGATPEEPSADAASSEPKEPAVIAVMVPAGQTEPSESWTVPTGARPETAEPSEPEATEPVGAASGVSQVGTGSLINTVPVHRPMSWLRRDSNEGDRSNPAG